MNLEIYGVNYKFCDIKTREKHCINTNEQYLLFDKLKHSGFVPSVIISTCNRTEYYFDKKNNIYENNSFKNLSGIDAIRHLFRLASGIESQIIGESEILSQIKQAYYNSIKLGMTNSFFNKIFQNAIKVGKYVRNETSISDGNISFASIIFNKSKEYFKDISNKNIFILGTGEMAKKMLKYFSAVQANVSVVSGKNYNRAALLASEYKVLINGFNEFKDSINIADIIITATASPHILISDTDLVYIKKPLLIFDLSVPRNVEKRTNNELVHLYNVDDLRQTSEYNLSERVKYIPVVEKIIENEINKLLQKN
ncbi:MAG: glutamyl-tRNA reductase [Elusimicrobia bacterium RIFOXYD2_FULL_34_15]|nr:MAG: glutamyl-tRNA reductase [Elusimicrobia bacterium RIFOXYD2_FULL_34_15]